MNKEQAKRKIKELIDKYHSVAASGKIKTYSEEETKLGFIQPLFEALGWNIFDKNEVTAEEQISGDRVDYGFYLNGRIKFYLEAKPLKADLYREEYAKQSIRYSWNKGVTWAVLTDFEGLIVFNALSPEKSLAGKKYLSFTYEEYLTRFDELWRLSKEAFGEDLLDKEAEKVGKKLQKISVTETLAKDLNDCREILTEAFIQWNEKVDSHLIDEGVQKLLNRLIFIRSAEDRKIEPPTLMPLIHEYQGSGKAGQITPYQAMVQKFRELDKIYNSNMFDEHPFEKWDEFNGDTEKVINILYGKKNYFEYDFSVIPADVLGNVYESYLGHQLKKSKKQEGLGKNLKKRKEQGIYYTPKYIVDYIVANALGPVLDKCQSINDLQKIKILDPACGSGSFLVAAMNFLIKKYEDFGAKPDGYLKIQILQNNIYGVDLDQQAVELARLNLLLNTFDSQTKLPNLGGNIKNGNSLISGTDEELTKYFGKNYRDKNPFNWQEEFPDAFKQGGFDVIIGNPPYINAKNGNFSDNEKVFYNKFFKTAEYQLDTYILFSELAISLLRVGGSLGFIIPNSWLANILLPKIRKFLLSETRIRKLVNIQQSTFKDASVDTIILICGKEKDNKGTSVEIASISDNEYKVISDTKQQIFLNNMNYIINVNLNGSGRETINRIENYSKKIGDILDISTGIKEYQVGKGKPPQTMDDKINSKFNANFKKDKTYIPELRGKNIFRYDFDWANTYVSYGNWLAEPRKEKYFEGHRILLRKIPSPNNLVATLISDKYIIDQSLYIGKIKTKDFNPEFILGVLNSKLIGWYFRCKNNEFDDLFPQIKIGQFKDLPIVNKDKNNQKILTDLVIKMLTLNKELREIAENSDQWQKFKDEISKTDKKIDEEVYGLYGLTEEEIKVVENLSKK